MLITHLAGRPHYHFSQVRKLTDRNQLNCPKSHTMKSHSYIAVESHEKASRTPVNWTTYSSREDHDMWKVSSGCLGQWAPVKVIEWTMTEHDSTREIKPENQTGTRYIRKKQNKTVNDANAHRQQCKCPWGHKRVGHDWATKWRQQFQTWGN